MPCAERFIGHAAHSIHVSREVGIDREIIKFSRPRPYFFRQPSIWMDHRLDTMPHQYLYRLLANRGVQGATLKDRSRRVLHNERSIIENDRTLQPQLIGDLNSIKIAARRRQRHYDTRLLRSLHRGTRIGRDLARGI